MSNLNPINIQKQIKDNSEDLHSFISELKLWEEDMKRKDRQLTNDRQEEVLPPVRRRIVSNVKTKVNKQENDEDKKHQRIASYDYKAWDKFDVDKACEEVDNLESSNENDVDYEETSAKQEEIFMKEKALYEKELGNQHVKACKWDKAIEAYTRAISAYARDPIFYANRALCYLKKKQYSLVEADCTESLKLDATYVKALMRRATAREALGQLEDARHDLIQALQLEPNNKQARRDLDRVKTAVSSAKLHKRVNKEREDASFTKKPTALNSERTETETITLSKAEKKMEATAFENTSLPLHKRITEKEISGETKWPALTECEATVDHHFKPPHLRSNKPLKQIEIYDIGSYVPKHECSANLSTCQPTNVDNTSKDKKSPLKPKQKSVLTMSTPASCVKCIPSRPKTSVQFHQSWNSIKIDKNLCFKFLKQVPGEDFPEIFKESLESETFSSIVTILASEFVAANEPVLQYLTGLSQVRRFSTIILFMSSLDKSNLLTLFEYCINKQECLQEDISELRKLYEI